MIIRATKKLLNISRIEPIKGTTEPVDDLPGEWYASLVSMGRPGKLSIHFLHHPTLITVLIPGKSLTQALLSLSGRASSLLRRQGFAALEPFFQLVSKPQILATNSRTMLGYMNTMKLSLEIHFVRADSLDEIDFSYLEDIHFEYLFGCKLSQGKYIRPGEILSEMIKRREKGN